MIKCLFKIPIVFLHPHNVKGTKEVQDIYVINNHNHANLLPSGTGKTSINIQVKDAMNLFGIHVVVTTGA